MLDELEFGKFIAKKRNQAGYSLRTFARKLSLSPTYLSNVENGIRPAPSGEAQIRIANLLMLSENECFTLFDLACKTKKEGTLPFDVMEYINNDNDIIEFLRISKKCNLSGKDLIKLI